LLLPRRRVDGVAVTRCLLDAIDATAAPLSRVDGVGRCPVVINHVFLYQTTHTRCVIN